MTLGKKLMEAGKEKLFSTWMLQESDLVQAAAHAYGKSQLVTVCLFIFPSLIPLLICMLW